MLKGIYHNIDDMKNRRQSITNKMVKQEKVIKEIETVTSKSSNLLRVGRIFLGLLSLFLSYWILTRALEPYTSGLLSYKGISESPPFLYVALSVSLFSLGSFLIIPIDDCYTRSLCISAIHAILATYLAYGLWKEFFGCVMSADSTCLWLTTRDDVNLITAVTFGHFVLDLIVGFTSDKFFSNSCKERLLTNDSILHHIACMVGLLTCYFAQTAVLPNSMFMLIEASTPFVNIHHAIRVWTSSNSSKESTNSTSSDVKMIIPGWFKILNGFLLWLSFGLIRMVSAHLLAGSMLYAFIMHPPALRGPSWMQIVPLIYLCCAVPMAVLLNSWFYRITRLLWKVISEGGKAADAVTKSEKRT